MLYASMYHLPMQYIYKITTEAIDATMLKELIKESRQIMKTTT